MGAVMNSRDFEQIVRDYEGRLYGFARRIVSNREDAEEVVQDAFVRAHRALRKMTPGERKGLPLRPWLYVITQNVARNRLRKKSVPSVSLDAIDDPESPSLGYSHYGLPEPFLERRASIERVEEALSRLPLRLRDTARLRFIEGHSHPEIAAIFRQPVGTAKAHVRRATLLMRKVIARQFFSAAS